jgi:2-keto-3-deoxy-L-rhamnonate aldolase RhmA
VARAKGNRIREMLTAGEVPLGVILTYIRMPAIMEVIGGAGYDFVVIDTQHSPFSLETVSDMCHFAVRAGLVPIVRPPSHSGSEVDRILDQGALGLMYPQVESRAEVEEVRRHISDVHLLVIQVESRAAIEGIGSIIEGEGVDVVEIGRHDLSASYGVPGQTRHPLVLEAVDSVVRECSSRGIAVGGYGRTREDTDDIIRRGVRWLMCQSDMGLIQAGLQSAVETAREVIKDANVRV